MATKKKLEDLLGKAYDALCGVASEQGGLSRYCDDGLLDEIAEAIDLDTAGDGKYYAVQYVGFDGPEWRKLGVKPQTRWGVCTDPRNPDKTWCLTGFSSKEEAETEFKKIVTDAVFGEAKKGEL
jgi:hypothetical protein